MEQIIASALIVIAILLVIFLVLRELMCWYWKINEGLRLLQRQITLLESIANNSRRTSKSLMTDEEKAQQYDMMEKEKQRAIEQEKLSKKDNK